MEEQVREFQILDDSYKALQAENYQLRDYVINLQSRLIESQVDYPQPPPQLREPREGEPMRDVEPIQHMTAPTAAMAPSAVSQLQAAAAAIAENDAGVTKPNPEDVGYLTAETAYGPRKPQPDSQTDPG